MKLLRISLFMALAACGFSAAPASAQFFLKNPDLRGPAVRGDEPGITIALPGATDEELRAGLVWTMRAAMNLAALQCQFEPTLLAVPNYNAMLTDHKDELKSSFDTLSKYFARRAKTKAAGQSAFDQFGTHVYSSFSTVSAQYIFCQTASKIGREALFLPRGELGKLAQERMRELRNSLVNHGEQALPGRNAMQMQTNIPRLDPICWKKDEWNYKKCGPVS